MELLTFTLIWKTKKKLYAIEDFVLPAPFYLMSAGVALIVAAAWWPLLYFIGIPVSQPLGLVAYLAMPGLAAWISSKPIFDGRSFIQYIASQVRYFQQPKIWYGLKPSRGAEIETYNLKSQVWLPIDEYVAIPRPRAATIPNKRKTQPKGKRKKR